MVTITGLYSKTDVYIIYGDCCVQWTVLSVGNCCVQWTMLPAGNLYTMNNAVLWKLLWTMNCAVSWASAHGELGFQTNMFVGDYCLQSTGLLFCFWDRCPFGDLVTKSWAILVTAVYNELDCLLETSIHDELCCLLETRWFALSLFRAQELCESRGGRPGLPTLINLRFLWT